MWTRHSKNSALDDVKQHERHAQKATKRTFAGWDNSKQVQGMESSAELGFRYGKPEKDTGFLQGRDLVFCSKSNDGRDCHEEIN